MSAPALYIHVPFCARACPYCDFDFQVGRSPPVEPFLAALELERRARGLPMGQAVHTVYIGGGTPSLLGPSGLTALLGWVDRHFDTAAAVERTVELNPEHVDEALLDALVAAGVGRVSLGVQSLGANALAELGRVHRGVQAQQALRAAVERGLSVSADLIVGWPGQRQAQLDDDIDGIVATGVDHVSVYALTVEPNTPWEALVRRGKRSMPDADVQAERSRHAAARIEAAGLRHYEVASFARPGAQARHNTTYWTWHDYLGLGPSAASAQYAADGSVTRRSNVRGYAQWVESGAEAEASIEQLGPVAAAGEGAWLGLRLLDGIDVARFFARFPGVDEAWLRARVATQIERGNLRWSDDGRLRVADERWLWHDEIGADLLFDEPPM